MNPTDKRALRSRLKAARLRLLPAERSEASARLCAGLLRSRVVLGAEAVALFWPMIELGELDLEQVDVHLRQAGVRVYYPFMHGGAHGFALTTSVGDLEVGARGFRQPSPRCPVAQRGDIDVIVAPALALTAEGVRLGYGAGFYDRVVPLLRPSAKVIGTCYRHELLRELPSDAHDQRVDVVATDSGVTAVGIAVG